MSNLFREIYIIRSQRYETDRASYHVSAEIDKAGSGLILGKDGLPAAADIPLLLNDFHAREILHITFGSVLTEKTIAGRWRFYERFISILRSNIEVYTQNLEKHFIRHLKSFRV